MGVWWGLGRARSFSWYLSSGGRMMEKAALPKKETERGSASLEAQGQLSHVTSSCFWKTRKWGKRKGLLKRSPAQNLWQGAPAPAPRLREEA